MKHFIDTENITRAELERLFEIAFKIENSKPEKFSNKLNGKVISTLFFEPSTRTRLSFESAVYKLGGRVISTENAGTSSSSQKCETLEDAIKVISGYADAIIIRHPDNDSSSRAASVSSVPIINAGSGSYAHPTQSLLDAFTIVKSRGVGRSVVRNTASAGGLKGQSKAIGSNNLTLDNLKICFIGDLKYGRTANSLIKLLALYSGIEVYLLAPQQMCLTDDVYALMDSKGIAYKNCKSFDCLPKDIDVLYQTRIQSERARDLKVDTKALKITKAVLDKFSQNTIVMHPLPRVDEICTDVDTDKRAVYFQQAHNGVPTRMAVLLTLLGENF
ncbi:MAG: aspartate carbamoyltransferase [Firmicutes bacterium]|nr:aspartate carbamoyltransferase [Bacillota bacterium]